MQQPVAHRGFVDETNGTLRVGRDIYTDPDLFETEVERIFEGGWIYGCHES